MAAQERAVRTRTALIESAAELFHRDGFEMASLTTISARAGVSNGALHFHFSNKAALADAVREVAVQRLREITTRESENALQTLIDATHALSRALSKDAVLRAGFDLRRFLERTRGGDDLRRLWQHWVEGVLVRADDEGSLAGDVTAQDVSDTIVSATVGFELLSRGDPHWLSNSTLTRFWELLLPRLAEGAVHGPLVAAGSTGAGVE
ncbi:ScbR family autoregulator-binding transcription factor [Streptomyces sp. PU-14G]|uniref:ScbR family autoregulator-binding transcription factor n=1 Tax=Streptomyces sp. PU-14G TaxID=2800808 RepID=UPI0034DF99C8